MNKTILVIEDEQPLIDIVSAKIKTCGCDVLSARSVKQALGYLKDQAKIDVIWLDHYLLGKENGLDFVEKVKNNEEWKKIPIFVVSNTASPDKVKTYLELGIKKYYTKADYRLDDILKDIKKALEEGENE